MHFYILCTLGSYLLVLIIRVLKIIVKVVGITSRKRLNYYELVKKKVTHSIIIIRYKF
jgi:hypothetical protein